MRQSQTRGDAVLERASRQLSEVKRQSSRLTYDLIRRQEAAIVGLVDGAPETLDTIGKAATALGLRVRLDETQDLTPAQQQTVETTLNIGQTDTDFLSEYEQTRGDI